MHRVLIASGVLGLGTAVVFGAAAVTATLFPNGPMVAAGMDVMWERGGVMMGGGGMKAMPVPMPGPVFAVDDTGKGEVVVPDVEPQPSN